MTPSGPEEMLAAASASMAERTGRTVEEWVALAAAARNRIDVGCRYEDPPESDLLYPARAPGQATHKFSLTSVDEITDEVERLVRAAYDQNG